MISSVTIQTDDPASRRCASDTLSVSPPNIGLAHAVAGLAAKVKFVDGIDERKIRRKAAWFRSALHQNCQELI